MALFTVSIRWAAVLNISVLCKWATEFVNGICHFASANIGHRFHHFIDIHYTCLNWFNAAVLLLYPGGSQVLLFTLFVSFLLPFWEYQSRHWNHEQSNGADKWHYSNFAMPPHFAFNACIAVFCDKWYYFFCCCCSSPKDSHTLRTWNESEMNGNDVNPIKLRQRCFLITRNWIQNEIGMANKQRAIVFIPL